MKALSLFTGCGGLDLAAELAGIEIAGQCEIDEACNKVLRHWWPNTPRWKDVRDVTANSVKERSGDIGLVFAGFPCQPHSLAGRRKGSRDERDLWPELRRVLCEIRPRWFVGENVPGLLSNEDGRFFGAVLRDLAALGYNVGWGVWGACDVGAPHKRERVFIVAYHPGVGRGAWRPEQPGQQGVCQSGGSGSGELAHADCDGLRKGIYNVNTANGWLETFGRSAFGSPDGTTLANAPSSIGRPLPSWGGRRGFADGGCVGNTASGSLRNDRQDDRPSNREIHIFADTGACSGNEILGDPGGAGQQEHDAATVADRAEYASGQCLGGTMGNAKCERPSRRYRLQKSAMHMQSNRDGRSAQPCVGGMYDGISCGMDFPGWPAGRGQEQYPWEPPRVVPGKSIIGRTAMIKMLGNAVVPQQAVILFRGIMELEIALLQQ